MDKKQIVQKTREYIERNLSKDLNLDDIADAMGYSKFYLGRIFAEYAGCTIHKYMQIRRLAEAASQLVETDKPIIEIAFEANYQSQQAFTNAFKLVYYCSPQKYRIKGRTMMGGMAA